MDTFQERIRYVAKKAGSQSELARRATALLVDRTITPQQVQYLCTSPKGEKPAQGSADTPVFAVVANVEAMWLATGIGPRDRDYPLAVLQFAKTIMDLPEEDTLRKLLIAKAAENYRIPIDFWHPERRPRTTTNEKGRK